MMMKLQKEEILLLGLKLQLHTSLSLSLVPVFYVKCLFLFQFHHFGALCNVYFPNFSYVFNFIDFYLLFGLLENSKCGDVLCQ